MKMYRGTPGMQLSWIVFHTWGMRRVKEGRRRRRGTHPDISKDYTISKDFIKNKHYCGAREMDR